VRRNTASSTAYTCTSARAGFPAASFTAIATGTFSRGLYSSRGVFTETASRFTAVPTLSGAYPTRTDGLPVKVDAGGDITCAMTKEANGNAVLHINLPEISLPPGFGGGAAAGNANFAQQMAMGEHLSGVHDEVPQQIEFFWRQLDLPAASGDTTPHKIDREIARNKDRQLSLCLVRMAQRGAQPRCQLGHAERLADIIVGAAVERIDL